MASLALEMVVMLLSMTGVVGDRGVFAIHVPHAYCPHNNKNGTPQQSRSHLHHQPVGKHRQLAARPDHQAHAPYQAAVQLPCEVPAAARWARKSQVVFSRKGNGRERPTIPHLSFFQKAPPTAQHTTPHALATQGNTGALQIPPPGHPEGPACEQRRTPRTLQRCNANAKGEGWHTSPACTCTLPLHLPLTS
jgi:hypothetical protein